MDNQEKEFVNVGMEQPAEVDHHDDVKIKVDGPNGGKGWMIAAICAFVAVIGLGAGLVFVWMSGNDTSKKVDEVQASLDARTAELNKFREVTGVESADELTGDDSLNLDLSELYKVLPKTDDLSVLFGLDRAYIKDTVDGKYQIASFPASDVADGEITSGFVAYFYRVLPDGEWKYSGFSGQAVPGCADLTEEELAAFNGILKCNE